MGALMDPQAWTTSAHGELPTSVEVKLVDFPEAGYLTSNTPPQGEIWIRGHSNTSGYLDLPEETREIFTSDGWVKTGDIGELNIDGNLKLTDRKKNLVKSLNGEYLALEKLESIYKSHDVVQNLCLYAHPQQTRPVAVIALDEQAMQALALELNVEIAGRNDLLHHPILLRALLGRMQQVGRDRGLANFEILEGIVPAQEEWTSDNGFMSAAQKLLRSVIVAKYQKDIDAVYRLNSQV
nr:long-chain-fatty-acid--coa ligase 1 [Quercus suber]